jgi:hypothetical protein
MAAASVADVEMPSQGIMAGMRELLHFHSGDELKQLVEAVLDDLGVPEHLKAAVDDDDDAPPAPAGVDHDPSTAFEKHEPDEGAFVDDEMLADDVGGLVSLGSGSLDAGIPMMESLSDLRGLMASGMDKHALVEAAQSRLLSIRGPWQGGERGYRRVVSRTWEGIAIEYLRSKGAKTPNYKTNVRLLVMELWKASDTMAAAHRAKSRQRRRSGSPTGSIASSDGLGTDTETAAGTVSDKKAYSSVFVEAPVLTAAQAGTAEATAEDSPANKSSAAVDAGAVMEARGRAEAAFDSWFEGIEAEITAADELVRAAERRVRLGRDATAVLDFLAAIRGVRALERRARAAMAKRCRGAESTSAALLATPGQ